MFDGDILVKLGGKLVNDDDIQLGLESGRVGTAQLGCCAAESRQVAVVIGSGPEELNDADSRDREA